jgi:hypothetical protein
MKHPARRRRALPLLLVVACMGAMPSVAPAQAERPKAPSPTKTGTPPAVRTMLLGFVLVMIGIGVNAIPSKRGHQD